MRRLRPHMCGGTGAGLAHLARAELVFGRQHLRRGSVGDELARQHQCAGEVSPHRVDVVQDGEHRAAFAVPAPHHADQVRHRSRVYGREGLVEQDEPRVLQQQAGKERTLQSARPTATRSAASRTLRGRPRKSPRRRVCGGRPAGPRSRRSRARGPSPRGRKRRSGKTGRRPTAAAGRRCRPARSRRRRSDPGAGGASRSPPSASWTCRPRWARRRLSGCPRRSRRAGDARPVAGRSRGSGPET